MESDVQYVPFQKCPKCDGQGTVSKPPCVPGDVYEWTSSALTHTCDVCSGQKIIPQYAIPQSQQFTFKNEEDTFL